MSRFPHFLVSGFVAFASIHLGCGNTDAPPECSADHFVGDVCAGLPPTAGCDDAVSAAGVSCAGSVTVASNAELQGALTGAKAGDCVLLQAGSYDEISVPANVSVLGAGASCVKASKVIIAAGDSAVLRGMEVGSGGVRVAEDAQGVVIESVRVKDSTGHGIVVAAGAVVAVKTSEIEGAGGIGLLALNAESVSVEASLVESTGGPGVWAQCGTGCDCPSPSAITLKDSIVRDTKQVGVALHGMTATLDGLDVSDMHPGDDFGQPGALSAAGCSNLTASKLHVKDNDAFDTMYGVLIDNSSARLGGDDEATGYSIEGALFGVWVQNTGADKDVTIQHGTLTKNRGVGMAVHGSDRCIVINWLTSSGTMMENLIEQGTGAAITVGDGLNWGNGACVNASNLTLLNNERVDALIDGNVGAGSSLVDSTSASADPNKAIVQQDCSGACVQPAGNAAITPVATVLYKLPGGPTPPPAQ